MRQETETERGGGWEKGGRERAGHRQLYNFEKINFVVSIKTAFFQRKKIAKDILLLCQNFVKSDGI